MHSIRDREVHSRIAVHLDLLGGCCHPETREQVAFRFADRYLTIREKGPAAVIADVKTIAEVAKAPARAFKNLKRAGKEDAYALLGRPDHRYELGEDGDLTVVELPGKCLFMVFLDDRMCIFNHAWIELDHYSPGRNAVDAENEYARKCFGEEIPL